MAKEQRLKKQKSLGQIAYEADTRDGSTNAEHPWNTAPPWKQRMYQRMAAAVARAVRRRGKGE